MSDKAKSKPKDAKPADKKAEPMKDADLDKVAGGINPQPLPPIAKRPQ